jgi:hypothetical protein
LRATFARRNADRTIVLRDIDALDTLSFADAQALARPANVILLIGGTSAGKQPRRLAASDLARVLARLDAEFEIVATSLPVRSLDRRVQRWHDELASASQPGRSRQTALLLRSAAGLAALFAANAARFVWQRARGGEVAGLAIMLRRRGG